jgi:hypothetical protein
MSGVKKLLPVQKLKWTWCCWFVWWRCIKYTGYMPPKGVTTPDDDLGRLWIKLFIAHEFLEFAWSVWGRPWRVFSRQHHLTATARPPCTWNIHYESNITLLSATADDGGSRFLGNVWTQFTVYVTLPATHSLLITKSLPWAPNISHGFNFFRITELKFCAVLE